MPSCWESVENELVYPSDKVVKVKNWRLALFWVLLQIAILLYIVVYSIVLNKGYQRYDTAIGSLNFKAKGLATTSHGVPYDSVDLVYPSLENDAFFLATSFLRTDQKQVVTGGCPDFSSPCPTMACTAPNNNNQDRGAGLGRLTGQCSNTTGGSGYCLATGWCPLEDKNSHSSTSTTLNGVDEFTLQITLRAYFPLLDSPQKFSIFGDDSGFFQPQFPSISELLNLPSLRAEYGGAALNNTIRNGGVVLLMVNFDCNLDRTANCSASFDNLFVPIDTKFKFRAYSYTAIPTIDNSTGTPVTKEVTQRTMFTYTGLRIVTVVGGRAGKFNFGAFATTIGAGIGLLSVATLVTDFAMKRCFPNRQKYLHATEDVVTDKEMDEHPASVLAHADADAHRTIAMERVNSLDAMANHTSRVSAKQADDYQRMQG